MRSVLFALALASSVVPIQVSAASRQDNCGCVTTAPEAPVDPVNMELARTLVRTITPRQDAQGDFNDQIRRMASFERIADEGLSEGIKADLESMLLKIEPIVLRHLDKIEEATTLAYARKFTPAELQAATAFAKTTEGRAFLSRVYEVPYDSAILQEQASLMTELAPAMADFQVATCKRQTAARVAAGEKRAKCRMA
ncbi:hypothetical protein KRR38_06815 [Novosphingobium sp. G106]|uniref:hypothetical protein n=1 Tax=Novosphingobium sp. G106 TaxID=2849500 RepID=UPI001C2DA549|nr:hypothetical protein [Novosphingobium sp. G106]MBV1687394.1 hypothetical protein [Novosphingobium sp. G106]